MAHNFYILCRSCNEQKNLKNYMSFLNSFEFRLRCANTQLCCSNGLGRLIDEFAANVPPYLAATNYSPPRWIRRKNDSPPFFREMMMMMMMKQKKARMMRILAMDPHGNLLSNAETASSYLILFRNANKNKIIFLLHS